jgi:xanthine dehydrogenase YagR molybdenum-binding subunit
MAGQVASGYQDIGIGSRTAIAAVEAEELGIETEDVIMRIGDTELPEGPLSGGSVAINSVAPAVRLAASQVRTKLFTLAAPLLGVGPEELDAAYGKLFVASDKLKSFTFKQAAAKMSGKTILRLPRQPLTAENRVMGAMIKVAS